VLRPCPLGLRRAVCATVCSGSLCLVLVRPGRRRPVVGRLAPLAGGRCPWLRWCPLSFCAVRQASVDSGVPPLPPVRFRCLQYALVTSGLWLLTPVFVRTLSLVACRCWCSGRFSAKEEDPFQGLTKNCSHRSVTRKFPIPIKYRNCNFFSVS
jgi:hypothetical protein